MSERQEKLYALNKGARVCIPAGEGHVSFVKARLFLDDGEPGFKYVGEIQAVSIETLDKTLFQAEISVLMDDIGTGILRPYRMHDRCCSLIFRACNKPVATMVHRVFLEQTFEQKQTFGISEVTFKVTSTHPDCIYVGYLPNKIEPFKRTRP